MKASTLLAAVCVILLAVSATAVNSLWEKELPGGIKGLFPNRAKSKSADYFRAELERARKAGNVGKSKDEELTMKAGAMALYNCYLAGGNRFCSACDRSKPSYSKARCALSENGYTKACLKYRRPVNFQSLYTNICA